MLAHQHLRMVIETLLEGVVLLELLILLIIGNQDILSVIGSLDTEGIVSLGNSTTLTPAGLQGHLSKRNRGGNTILLLLLDGHRSILLEKCLLL